MRPPNQDNLTLTALTAQEREGATEDTDDENLRGSLFNPSITTKMNLADCFRIFVDPNKVTNELAECQPKPRRENFQEDKIMVYTNGSYTNNRKINT